MKRFIAGILSGIVFLAPIKLWSAEILPWTPTEQEFGSLPRYCWVKMKTPQNSPEYEMNRLQYGKDFEHVHHYCAGMNFASRFMRLPNPKDREYYKNKAFDNYKYMFDHASPTFALIPDVFISRGNLYLSSDQANLALSDYKKALELRPNSSAAHLAVVDWYKKFKQNDAALAAATDGLRRVPGNKGLQKRYLALGGKEPFPEPESTLVNSAARANESVGPAEIREKSQELPLLTPVDAAKSVDGEDLKEGKIGVKDNPWCRFCSEVPSSK